MRLGLNVTFRRNPCFWKERYQKGWIAVHLLKGSLFLGGLWFFCLPAIATAGTWTSVGPEGGTINEVSVSPNFPMDRTLFAATSDGGVYKSSDGGVTWVAVNAGLGSFSVASVALSASYATDRTVFVGTNGSFMMLRKTNYLPLKCGELERPCANFYIRMIWQMLVFI